MASGRCDSPDEADESCANQNIDCNAIFSPQNENSTPNNSCKQRSQTRQPLEEFDPNSQDSGYGGIENFQTRSFRFAEPLGVAPRRLDGRTPPRSPTCSSPLRKRVARPALFRSISSGYESNDEGLFEDDMDSDRDLEAKQPTNFSTLISSKISTQPMQLDIATTPEAPRIRQPRPRMNLRRSFSLHNSGSDEDEAVSISGVFRVRSCLFRSPNATSSTAKLGFEDEQSTRISCRRHCSESPFGVARSFKRPSPPVNHEPALIAKRSRKTTDELLIHPLSELPTSPALADSAPLLTPPPVLQRSVSEKSFEPESHDHIKSAIHRSTTDADLTGDFSKQCILPLAEGQHEDLKSISSETLSRLINGDFNDLVAEFKIVDCRYPYEFEAGHIEGAVNLYTKDMIEQFLMDPLTHKPSIEPDNQKRNIIVFHCEFSWERGPNMSRFLRNIDRQRNKEHYPALHYPEIYLLHGGYQQFFKEQRQLCIPQGYRPMKDPAHEADLRIFRIKSKSWQGERISRTNVITARANLKRLGF